MTYLLQRNNDRGTAQAAPLLYIDYVSINRCRYSLRLYANIPLFERFASRPLYPLTIPIYL